MEREGKRGIERGKKGKEEGRNLGKIGRLESCVKGRRQEGV